MSSRHFLTIRPSCSRLAAALTLSLFLHLLPFLPTDIFAPKKPSTAAILQASLRPPPSPVAAPPLELPPETHRSPAPKPAPAREKSKPPAPATWTQAVRQQLQKLDAAGQFYPPEAIARGLQGEVLVLFVLDENGHVVAARVEQGSGQAILDDAALRAVRSLRSLPADAPQQGLLPVRFRLR